jgi:putative transposase
MMDGKNRRHASAFTVRVSIRPLAPERTSDPCDRECSTTHADSGVSTKRKRPLLTTLDRVFWVTLRSVWSDWRHPLIYVQADTVVRWERERFRKFWARMSNPDRRRRGRPGTAPELRRLIEEMAAANPLWRAPRIHGELQMLGIAISERTVSRILRRLPRHFNVTEHPTGTWTAQEIVEAFADREAASYFIRDRDSRYSAEVRRRIHSLSIEETRTASRSPWQNPDAERLIGSIRRECLNRYIILNASLLKGTLSYFRYYHESRTHLSLGKQCPFPQEALSVGKIAIPHLVAFISDMNGSQPSSCCSDQLLANDTTLRARVRVIGLKPEHA